MEKLLKVVFNNIFLYRIWFFILAISLLMLPVLFTDKHFLYNLEPYPDGLLYSLSARNVVIEGNLALRYQDSVLPLWVPPLYSIILIPAYVWNTSPSSFYLANISLLFVSLYFFDKTLSICKLQRWIHLTGLAIFSLHGYLLWLPLVPMSENASLAITPILLYLLFKRENKYLLLAGLVALLLFFTRYSMVSVTAVVFLILFVIVIRSNINKLWKFTATFTLIILPLVLLLYDLLGHSSIINYVYKDAFSNQVFYGVKYLVINSMEYLRSLAGLPSPFLWKREPLSTVAISLPALIFIVYRSIKRNYTALVLLLLTLGILIAPLLFYTVDNRYIVQIIPIITMGYILAIQSISKTRQWPTYIFTILSTLMLIISQVNIYKELLASNILRRSTAWQYEAIQHFNEQLPPDSYLITAIPPHLVDAYNTSTYRVLPLSDSQEFLQHKQYVWGSDINYDDLITTYEALLREGKAVYISNAYITHQQSVIMDFERLTSVFNLELISEGCYSACNIYKVSAN